MIVPDNRLSLSVLTIDITRWWDAPMARAACRQLGHNNRGRIENQISSTQERTNKADSDR